MANFTRFPSSSTMFSAYASVSASIMLVQTTFNQLVPRQLQEYISSAIRYYFKPQSSKFVLIIEENDGISSNEIYKAAEVYLSSKIDTSLQSLKISKRPKETGIRMRFARCEKIADFYEGVEITWRFNSEEMKKGSPKFIEDDSETTYTNDEKRFFELSFEKEYKEKVIDFYIPFVLQRAKDIRNEKKVVKLHTLIPFSYSSGVAWESINLEHPTTFENIAMEKSLKQAIIDDLDRFVMRKDFYRKVGKAWKRGYLLHGPPGTGKSSLVAAIANYLKFDVYDLELSSIKRDSDLRRLLLKTANRSILVIEDIDCSVTLPNRKKSSNSDGPQAESQLPFTLSGLLNFIDGLWSSCGDERIIVFTTNNKDKLDPALLRPGRMDMHICMSYISIDGCKQLISNYLNMDHHHQEHEHVHEIEGLIGNMNVTPAEVAGELMKSDDAEVSLVGLVNFLKRKKIDDEEKEIKNEGAEENEVEVELQLPKSKKLKLDINEDAVPTMDNGLKFDFISEIVI